MQIPTEKTMIYSWLVLLPLFSTIKVYIQGKLARDRVKSTSDLFLLNGLIFASLVVIMTPLFYRQIPPVEIILLCMLRAAISMLFQVFYSLAFKTGPVSLTAIIVGFHIIFPMMAGIIAFNEELTLISIIGIILIFFAICTIPARKGSDSKANLKWLVITLIAFVLSGVNNSITTIFSRSSYAEYNDEYIITGYIFASLFCFIIWALKRKDGGVLPGHLKGGRKSMLPIAAGVIGIAVVLGAYNIGLIHATASIASIILFPIRSVLGIMMNLLVDIIFYKQRFTKLQFLGIIVGTVAVVMLNL